MVKKVEVKAPAAETDSVFVVNRRGVVHEATKEHARMVLRERRGYRLATDEEIARYKAAGGNQSAEDLPDLGDEDPLRSVVIPTSSEKRHVAAVDRTAR